MFAKTMGFLLQLGIFYILVAYAFYSLPELRARVLFEETCTTEYIVVLATIFILAIWYYRKIRRGRVVKIGFLYALAALSGIALSVSAQKYGFEYIFYWFAGGYVMLALAIFCGINATRDLRPLFSLVSIACVVGTIILLIWGYEAFSSLWCDIFWAVIAFLFTIIEVQDFCFNITEIENPEEVDDLVHPMTINLFCNLLLFGAVFNLSRLAVKFLTFTWLGRIKHD